MKHVVVGSTGQTRAGLCVDGTVDGVALCVDGTVDGVALCVDGTVDGVALCVDGTVDGVALCAEGSCLMEILVGCAYLSDLLDLGPSLANERATLAGRNDQAQGDRGLGADSAVGYQRGQVLQKGNRKRI